MTEVADRLFAKAERFLADAALLSQAGRLESAASRAYCALFFIAEALLAAQGLTFSKHSAVIAAYGARFAKTGRLDPQFHRLLLDAGADRQLADYAAEAALLPERIERYLREGPVFLAAARALVHERC